MATPNMATITASLERSMQNCSLNHQQSSSGGGSGASRSDSPPPDSATPTLELNSEASLPFHWEQCLDLKSGEIYYINWRTGMKATEDPRRAAAEHGGGCFSDDVYSISYDSEGSSSESSPSSREQWSGKSNRDNCYYQERNENNEKYSDSNNNDNNNNNYNNNSSSSSVLVVGGCKSCLMYYMVPKQLQICPKCCGQLLHFDRPENASS